MKVTIIRIRKRYSTHLNIVQTFQVNALKLWIKQGNGQVIFLLAQRKIVYQHFL
ncbi:hypothetical protein [Heyndrickxia oleronia]|uniref:hypothetical protein n=1 Tax=Heyndrickxia oleronia TaxID=38875 RepID=UPI001BB45FAA|nr:hypothetical protein [Heyndrickxia oleronia]